MLKKLLFSHNKKIESQISLQNHILPAVTTEICCFKLFFEKQFCLNNRPLVFSVIDNHFDFRNQILNDAKFLCLLLTACKILNKSKKRLLRYCTFIFSLSCRIASVTSYLSENEARNLQNGDVDLAQISDFETGHLENHLIEVSEGFFHISCSFI